MKKRFDELDGLKGLFCIGIVICHYFSIIGFSDIHNVPNLCDSIYYYGFLGVEFFFMLSGFLMSYTYKGQVNNMSIRQFLLRRFNHLYPSYFFTVLFGIGIAYLDIKITDGKIVSRPVNLYNIFRAFTMTTRGWVENDINPYGSGSWFVNVLLLCYIFYFFILKKTKNNTEYMICCIVLVLIGWSCYIKNTNIPFLSKFDGRGYMSFFIGCIAAEIYNSNVLKRSYILIAFIADLIVAFMAFKIDFFYVFGEPTLACNFFVFPVLIISTITLPFLKKIFTIKPIINFGKMSMGVYFSHAMVMIFIVMMNIRFNLGMSFSKYSTMGWIFIIIFVIGLIWNCTISKLSLKKIIERSFN